MPVIDLSTYHQRVGPVRLPSGREVYVEPMTATARRLYLGIQQAVHSETAMADEADLWRLAAVLMPEATAEEIDALTPTMIGVVTRLAAGGIEEVERIIAEGKGRELAANPAPPSTTTSPTP